MKMPKWVAAGCLALLAIATTSACADATFTHIQRGATVLDPDLPRYGLNLGGSGTWGAEHLRANVLANPGFEPVLDRTLLILKEASAGRMVDDTPWLARPNGFWDNAGFHLLSGRQAGAGGSILTSSRRHADGLAEFQLETPMEGLRTGDVAVATRPRDMQPAAQWWVGRGRLANSAEVRPGSAGRQSLQMLASRGEPVELLHFLDNITDRAGKLLLVNGVWKLEFWARASKPGASLRIYFGRAGSKPFVETSARVETTWKRHSFEFNASDTGPDGVLTLSLTALEGEILLDDAYLGEANPGVGGFRQVVVETLRDLRPGYLRDWQGQLGDTFANRVALEHGHQPVRYRPGDNEIQFHYSLPDFFELCAKVGARPWVVAPTTLTHAEWRELGAYLRQSAERYGFDEILLEFGNENWNQIFRPGGIPDAATHAMVADRAFKLVKEGSRNDGRIITVANAQYVNADSPREIGARSRESDRIAVAPYMVNSLEHGMDIASMHHAAFEENGDLLGRQSQMAQMQHKKLSVYEVNFHTTWGNAEKAERNAVVTGAGSGAALARRLMQATLAGVREQGVYVLSGFDSYTAEGKELVRLWGITRDLTVPSHLRPTGLALQMLNRAAGGLTTTARCAGDACTGLTALYFGDGSRMAVVSASHEPTPVKLQMACGVGNATLQVLDGSRPELNNEKETQVRVQQRKLPCQRGLVAFTLPGHSLAVVTKAD